MNSLSIMKGRLKVIFSSFKGKRNELIPILQNVQLEFGYLSKEAMLEVASFTGLPSACVYSTASFYAQFRFSPVGQNKITVCRGTACHVNGAPRVLEEISRQLGIGEGETTPDLKYTLETVACIGCCGLAPSVVINNKVMARMTPKKITELFKNEDTGHGS